MTKKYDWESIEEDILAGNLSFPKIAEKHGIDRSYLHKQVKKRNLKRGKSTKVHIVDLIEGAFISEFARDRYYLTKEKMGDEWTIIDDNILIPLCNQYARVIELEKIVQVEGVTIISSKTGAPYANPNYNALQGSIKTVASLGKELALTVASRKRAGISPNTDKEKDDFWDSIINRDSFQNTDPSKPNYLNV